VAQFGRSVESESLFESRLSPNSTPVPSVITVTIRDSEGGAPGGEANLNKGSGRGSQWNAISRTRDCQY
jgi:hypothetical protein